MPSQNGMMVLLGAAMGLLAASTSVGCVGGVCEEFPRLCGDGLGGGGVGGDGGATTSTSNGGNGQGGNGGEGGGLPVDCDPLAVAAGTAVPASCGVFVDTASTAAGESGTQAAPYKTLAAALGAAAADQPIYVCTSPLDEAALIEADARLYGGLDCATWQTGAAAARTPWTAPANEIPLAVRGAGVSATVAGFAITARDAAGFDAATRQGRSSVAAWVEEASVTLARVDLVAGVAAAGGAGESQSGAAPGMQSDAAAFNGNNGGGCGMAGGASKVVSLCDGGNTIGGKGGDGDFAQGASGIGGTPALGGGSAGVGEPSPIGTWSCSSVGNGASGTEGPNGTPGPGGTALGTLAFSLTGLLHLNAPGADGTPGGRGQGGGGGGGRRGDGQNGCAAGVTGPSGGGGGAGGCGGLPGQGGGAGGSSIALVSVSATVTTSGVTFAASAGGIGGAGGNGQLGGNGGNGGNGGGNACSGGAGGAGGLGGSGGGGRGGASLGVAYVGTAPAFNPDDVTVAAAPAAGGAAGNGATAGAAGLAQASEEFPAE